MVARKALDNSQVIELFKTGNSVKKIAEKLCCSRTPIQRILKEAGIKARGRSESMFLRMAQTSAEERQQLASAAHEAVRGRKASFEEKCKRAQTKFERQYSASPRAFELQQRFTEAGVDTALEWPIGPYNIDLVMEGRFIAIEIHGGQWHSWGYHREARPERVRYVTEEQRWSLVEIWGVFAGWDADAVAKRILELAPSIDNNDDSQRGQHIRLLSDGEHAGDNATSHGNF